MNGFISQIKLLMLQGYHLVALCALVNSVFVPYVRLTILLIIWLCPVPMLGSLWSRRSRSYAVHFCYLWLKLTGIDLAGTFAFLVFSSLSLRLDPMDGSPRAHNTRWDAKTLGAGIEVVGFPGEAIFSYLAALALTSIVSLLVTTVHHRCEKMDERSVVRDIAEKHGEPGKEPFGGAGGGGDIGEPPLSPPLLPIKNIRTRETDITTTSTPSDAASPVTLNQYARKKTSVGQYVRERGRKIGAPKNEWGKTDDDDDDGGRGVNTPSSGSHATMTTHLGFAPSPSLEDANINCPKGTKKLTSSKEKESKLRSFSRLSTINNVLIVPVRGHCARAWGCYRDHEFIIITLAFPLLIALLVTSLLVPVTAVSYHGFLGFFILQSHGDQQPNMHEEDFFMGDDFYKEKTWYGPEETSLLQVGMRFLFIMLRADNIYTAPNSGAGGPYVGPEVITFLVYFLLCAMLIPCVVIVGALVLWFLPLPRSTWVRLEPALEILHAVSLVESCMLAALVMVPLMKYMIESSMDEKCPSELIDHLFGDRMEPECGIIRTKVLWPIAFFVVAALLNMMLLCRMVYLTKSAIKDTERLEDVVPKSGADTTDEKKMVRRTKEREELVKRLRNKMEAPLWI